MKNSMQCSKIKIALFYIVLIIFATAMLKTYNIADPDLWHRFAVGKHFMEEGELSVKDIYSYMPTKSLWVDHEWGSGVVFYYIYKNYGAIGLVSLKLVLNILILLLIISTIKLIKSDVNRYHLLFYIITVIGLFSAYFLTVRCHVFTYFFITLWIYLLEKSRDGSLWLIIIFPVTIVLWLNLHGGFVAGIGLVGVYCFVQLFKKKKNLRYFIILGSIIPVLFINPYFEKYLIYIFKAVTMPRPMIGEWRPIDLFGSIADYPGFKILLVLAALITIFKVMKKEWKINYEGWLFCLVTLYLSLRHKRHRVFFIITVSCFIYPYVFDLIDRFIVYVKKNTDLKRFKLLYFTFSSAIYIFIFSFSVYAMATTAFEFRIPKEMYPVEAVEYIKHNKLKGNILVGINYGSYTMWNLYPECLVASDGRYEECYISELFDGVHNFFAAKKGWREFLGKYKHDHILMTNDEPVFPEIMKLPDWKLVHKDEFASLFSKVKK